ncbi:hypothetical protein AWB75_06680 [Caballeronia catudaia]|uniref:Uncharacterized protein n=1 Tax=Caballeronia catudaia TaxID=1777136 RepID=A0A158DI44_9BURK|nr:hypothetical protein [Caballeronia catudaia]SAK93477.1 hypothetical protein AWB75_06680 [Caballeronia catudaia]
MWTADHKKEFIKSAFEQVHLNSRGVRDRMHANVRYAVTLFVVVSGFFLVKTKTLSPELAVSAGIGVVVFALLYIRVLMAQFRTLETLHVIQANLEKAMLFHAEGTYFSDLEILFPQERASAKRLADLSYYSKTKSAYILVVCGSAMFSLVVIVVASVDQTILDGVFAPFGAWIEGLHHGWLGN